LIAEADTSVHHVTVMIIAEYTVVAQRTMMRLDGHDFVAHVAVLCVHTLGHAAVAAARLL
jgi:hypothetical protein